MLAKSKNAKKSASTIDKRLPTVGFNRPFCNNFCKIQRIALKFTFWEFQIHNFGVQLFFNNLCCCFPKLVQNDMARG